MTLVRRRKRFKKVILWQILNQESLQELKDFFLKPQPENENIENSYTPTHLTSQDNLAQITPVHTQSLKKILKTIFYFFLKK